MDKKVFIPRSEMCFKAFFTARFRAEGLSSPIQISNRSPRIYSCSHSDSERFKKLRMPQLNPVELHSNVDQR